MTCGLIGPLPDGHGSVADTADLVASIETKSSPLPIYKSSREKPYGAARMACVTVMPLERGGARHYDLAGKRNFHRGLLKRATDSRMKTEIKFHRALRMQLPKEIS